MLQIDVITREEFNDETNEFITETFRIDLEHSLLSLSKWESVYQKPFVNSKELTTEEMLDYVRMMTLNEVPDDVFNKLSIQDFTRINEYISSKQTATWFNERQHRPKTSNEIITSELIYYWMFSYNIPIECERWHLNRLLTLIRIFSVKSEKPKKQSRSDIARQNRELNAQRRAALHSAG